MNAPINWSDLTESQRYRLLSRQPLALACSIRGAWDSSSKAVLVGGSLVWTPAYSHHSGGVLHLAVNRSYRWVMEAHDPTSTRLELAFDINHEGTAAHLRWVLPS